MNTLARIHTRLAQVPAGWWFTLLCVESILVFRGALRAWLNVAGRDAYNHIVLIPAMSVCLIYWARRSIFAGTGSRWSSRMPLLVLGVPGLAVLLARVLPMDPEYRLSVEMLALVVVWVVGFALCFGVRALRTAQFPFFFLLLMVPLPSTLMDSVIRMLQRGSAELSHAGFRLAGVPLFRDGTRFELPGIGIEVAKECSSIHSGWALFIVGILLAHFVLRTLPAKACVVMLTLPTAMFTNAVRIVTLWFLATHVDIGFLSGRLHHRGGILFSVISLTVVLLFLFFFRELENRVVGHRKIETLRA